MGDFDLAEDALQDAFAAAAEKWPREGVPTNPRAWLVSAGRFRAIDGLRRRARFDASMVQLTARLEAKDLDEAIGIAPRVPVAGVGTIEIRPVLEISGLP